MFRQFLALDRSLQILILNELTISLSFYMLYPYLAVYFTRDLGMTTGVVGLVLGIRVLSQQGLTIVGGTLSDRIGFKPVIVMGLLLRTVGFGLFAVVTSFSGVLVAALLSGLAGALFAPASRGYMAVAAPDRRAEVFALTNVFSRIGMLSGPPLGVVLLAVNFQSMALVASGLFLALMLVQIAYLPSRSSPAGQSGSVLQSWGEVFSNRQFMLFSLTMLGSLSLFNQLYLALPLEVARVTGGTAGTGLLFALSGVLTIAGQMSVTRYCEARWRTPRSIALGLVLMGIAFVPPMLTQTVLPVEGGLGAPWIAVNAAPVIVSGLLLTLGLMVLTPFAQELIPILGRERLVGTYFGVYSMAGGFATAISTVATGVTFDIGESVGFPALPWILMTAVGLASAAGLLLLDRGAALPTTGASRRPGLPGTP